MTCGASSSSKQTMTSLGLKSMSPSADRPHSIPAFTTWTSSLWCLSAAREPAGNITGTVRERCRQEGCLSSVIASHLPSQTESRPRISLNLRRRSSWPFWTRQPATGTFFFPTVTSNMARTVASPGRAQRQSRWHFLSGTGSNIEGRRSLEFSLVLKWNLATKIKRFFICLQLTEDVLRHERRQFAAQLVLQLIDQFVNDVVKTQRDASLRRQLLDRPAGSHIEAVNRTWQRRKEEDRGWGHWNPLSSMSHSFKATLRSCSIKNTEMEVELVTRERFSHVDVILRNVSDAKVKDIELTLMLSVVTVQDVQDGLHRPVHITWRSKRVNKGVTILMSVSFNFTET